MAKESNIVTYINDKLIAEQFGSVKFKKGQFSGIAELVKTNEGGETQPVIVANNGKSTRIGINDIYPFQIYHRTLSASFELVSADFGDFRVRKESTSMTLVVIADRERLEVTKEQIKTALALGFPLEMDATNKTALSLLTCNITPSSFIMDFNEVYSREFNLANYKIKPQTILIALDYTIETEVNESCIEICA